MAEHPASAERREWWAEFDAADRLLTSQVVEWLVDAVTPIATVAVVDAYSDYRNELPPDVEMAQTRLRELGATQGNRDSGMAVKVVVRPGADFAAFRLYAAWSIQADLYDDDDASHPGRPRGFLYVHDCGYGVTAHLTNAQVERFNADFASRASLKFFTTPPAPEPRDRRGLGGLRRIIGRRH